VAQQVRGQGVAGGEGQLVLPVGGDDEDGRGAHSRGEEGQQEQGGRVGPMDVLESDEQRPVGSCPMKGGGHLLEEPKACQPSLGRACGGGFIRRRDRERQGGQGLLPGPVGLGEGPMPAAAPGHREPCVGSQAGGLLGAGRLPDPGLATEEDEGTPAACGRVDPAGQPRQLPLSTHQIT
jgi:hypothetical protein